MTAGHEWTLEEAQAESDKALADNPARESYDPTLPLFQWFALKRLEECREAFHRGDEYELMHAIRICANHGLPLPEWAAMAYIKAYDSVINARAKSWDEVFGAPYPKGKHLNATRKKRMLEFAVYNRINEILRGEPVTSAMPQRTPTDGYLLERVAKEFHIGKTLAAEYYGSAEAKMRRLRSA